MKLALAHLFGDFLLQPSKWVSHKEEHHHRSRYLYLHALLHGLLAYLFLAKWDQWWIIPVIAGSHLLIDIIKSYLKEPKVLWFLADQAAHFAVIIFVWNKVSQVGIDVMEYTWGNKQFLLVAVAYFTVTLPFSFLISQAVDTWKKKLSNDTGNLQNAGRWIGMIERVLVLSFILADQYEAIGFLLAAKSVFRFGDLKDAQDKNLTEYILIGTLLSFGLVILFGMCIKLLW